MTLITFQQPLKYKSAKANYNGIFLMFMLLGLPVVLSMTSRFTLAVFSFGVLFVYVLDSFFKMTKYALLLMWISLGFAWIPIYGKSVKGFLFSSTFVGGFFTSIVAFHGSLYLGLLGVWGSLQFPYFRQNTKFAILAERILFVCVPLNAIPLIISSWIAVSKVDNSPLVFSLVMVIILYLFVFPSKSSFIDQEELNDRNRIQGMIETQFLELFSIVGPMLMYIFVYHRLFSFTFFHICNMGLLFSMPLILIFSFPQDLLWWAKVDWKKHQKVRLVILMFLHFLVSIWFEYRVVYLRYPQLLYGLPPPLNYIVLTVCMGILSILSVFLLHGRLSKETNSVIVGLFSLVSIIGTYALNFPLWFIPIPVLATASGLAFLFFKVRKYYFVFGLSATLTASLWLWQSFGYLEYEFEGRFLPFEWTIRFSHLIGAISLYIALTFSLFPVLKTMKDKPITTVVFSTHAFLLGVIEQFLYEQGNDFYSGVLIMLTSFCGFYFSYNLFLRKEISMDGAGFLISIYIAKLAIILQVRAGMIAAFFAILMFVRLQLSSLGNEVLSKRTAWIYVFLSGFFLIVTRGTLTEKCIQIVFNTATADTSQQFGVVFFLWGLSLLPLSYRMMSNVRLLKTFNLLLLISGVVMAFLQPLLHSSGSVLSDNTFEHETQIIAPWVFLFIVFLFLSLSLKLVPMPNDKYLPYLFGFFGLGGGFVYCCYFLHFISYLAQLTICLSCLLIALLIYVVHFKGIHFRIALTLYISCILSFIVSCFISGVEDFDLKPAANFGILGVATFTMLLFLLLSRFYVAGIPLLKGEDSQVVNHVKYATLTNVSVILTFFMLTLFFWMSNSSSLTSRLIICPLFLVLTRDQFLLRKFDERWRYAATLFTMELVLVCYLFSESITSYIWVSILWNVFLVILNLPSLVFSHQFFIYFTPIPLHVVIICLSLSVTSMFVASFESVRSLSTICSALSLLIGFISLKFIKKQDDAIESLKLQF